MRAEEAAGDDHIELLDEVVELVIPGDPPAIPQNRAGGGEVGRSLRTPRAGAPGERRRESFGDEREDDEGPRAGAEECGDDHRDCGDEGGDGFNAIECAKIEAAGEQCAREAADGVEEESEAERGEQGSKGRGGVET